MATGLIAAVWGAVDIAVFTDQTTLALPLRMLLSVMMASTGAQTLAGDLTDFETVAARRIPAYDVLLALALILSGSAVLSATLVTAGTTDALPALLRNLILWTGVAVVSGRLLHPKLCWVVPIAVQLPLQWRGFSADGNGEWWAVSLHPDTPGPGSWPSRCALPHSPGSHSPPSTGTAYA